MRIIVVVLLILIAQVANGSSTKAYIVLRAIVVDGEVRQPSWICMASSFECKHVSASKIIVSITPGVFRLDHIDFGKAEGSGEGAIANNSSLFFKEPTTYRFEAGNIYLIGQFNLIKKSSHRYKIEFSSEANLLLDACAVAPELFESHPLTSFDGTKKTKINCEIIGGKTPQQDAQ
jgi:hypothetical protein